MQEKIIAILSELKQDPTLLATITGTSDIVNDVGLDSLQMIQFILKVEDELDVQIDYDGFDFQYLQSVDAFVDFLQTKAGS